MTPANQKPEEHRAIQILNEDELRHVVGGTEIPAIRYERRSADDQDR